VAFFGLSESEAAAAAESLVGKNAMSGFLALMNAAPEDIDKLSSCYRELRWYCRKHGGDMQDNLKGQLTILKSQLEELAISFGELLMPAIRAVVSKVQPSWTSSTTWRSAEEDHFESAALAAAIGPLLVVLAKRYPHRISHEGLCEDCES
jgi:TP901 family phage tail tape measure protein